MKISQKHNVNARETDRFWRILLAGLMLVVSACTGWAQNVTIDTFASSAEVANFGYNNWNGSPGSVAFSSNDAQGNASSGSMQMNITYNNGSENGLAFISSAAPMPVNLSTATFIEFDMMVDPTSPLDANGNAYYFQIGFNSPYSSFFKIGAFWLGPWGTPFTAGVWQHFKIAVPAGALNGSSSLAINPYDANYTSAQTSITYIDNIVIDIPTPTYPNYVGFTFDNTNSLTASNSIAGPNWYGEATTISWATNNSTIANASVTPVAGSGSAYIVAQFDNTAVNNADVIALAFDTNYFVSGGFPGSEANTNDIINGNQYSAVEFDVLWDTNNSTMSISNFNSMGDIYGAPVGLLEPPNVNPNSGQELTSTDPAIPDTASNGWVHLRIAIPGSTAGLSDVIGLFLKKYGSGTNGAISGTAAYWIDNVVFDGAPLLVPSPKMSISKPVSGLNIINNDGPYDRESLVTFAYNFTWVDQPDPVTYAMNIAAFPGTNNANYNARFYLVPNSAADESEPDWTEQYLAMISVGLNNTGQATATIGMKNSQPGSGNGDLYDSTNPLFTTTNSGVVGNWSFTFTDNTNIVVVAPDGESTNWILPLLTSSQLESQFGNSAMVVYLGGYDNGSANIGQGVTFASVGITNGSTQLLYDNFQQDSTINSGVWIKASDGSVPSTYLTAPTSEYYVDWTAPAVGFLVQTNSNLSNGSGWSTNDPFTVYQLGGHFQTTVDATNLPSPGGNLFFRLNNAPTQ
jgi:hypothetical protein